MGHCYVNMLCWHVSYPTSWRSLPIASVNVTETQDADLCIMVCPKVLANYDVFVSHPPLLGADKVTGELVAACHSYPWWRWSNTLWETLRRLRQHLFCHVILQSVVGEFCLQISYIYILLCSLLLMFFCSWVVCLCLFCCCFFSNASVVNAFFFSFHQECLGFPILQFSHQVV